MEDNGNLYTQLKAALHLIKLRFKMISFDGCSACAVVFIDQSSGEQPLSLNVELKGKDSNAFRWLGSVGVAVVTHCSLGHPDFVSKDHEFDTWSALPTIVDGLLEMAKYEIDLIRQGVVQPVRIAGAEPRTTPDYDVGKVSGQVLIAELTEAMSILHWSFINLKTEDYQASLTAVPPEGEQMRISISSRKRDLFKSGRAMLQVEPSGLPQVVYDSEGGERLAELIKFVIQ